MVKCVCDKAIDKVPDWLSSVQVDFVCTNCPRRQVKTISQLHAEQMANAGINEAEIKSVDMFEEEDDKEED
jgi:hypothetical protein